MKPTASIPAYTFCIFFHRVSRAFGRVYLRTACCWLLCVLSLPVPAQKNKRQDILLHTGWRTVAAATGDSSYAHCAAPGYNDRGWLLTDVPHNWDGYEGYRQLKHGNRHGYAWYRKKFRLPQPAPSARVFLWFEGVGSYATVWLNGKQVGQHAGGRTSFTLDITAAILYNAENTLAVRADHPASIRDLPWVCGGCSDEQGFSEGSQPMGIFRPVHLVITAPVRVEPFGVHVWNDSSITAAAATVHATTEIKNYGERQRSITLVTQVLDATGKTICTLRQTKQLDAGATAVFRQTTPVITRPHLWSLDTPYLYTLVSTVTGDNKVLDEQRTTFGIRTIRWPSPGDQQHTFLLNGQPVFINGTAEYEHLLGNSHAFTAQQVRSRVMQVKAAGFNAFRDAHQPHNLLYQQYWDRLGMLWWPQFAAHIWFDTPAFRKQFIALLKDWVKERRNSPSLVLWGLENESVLPEDFARECSDVIRSLDPTASSQRKITTCNGGSGTDWDVPQNWSGTYSGNPASYAAELKQQLLVGEYGAWRSIDRHTAGPWRQTTANSEDYMTQLMEMKLRLAESVRGEVAGHFNWLLASHDNPGRVQPDEGFRYIDKTGPVNNKGLFTIWGEPVDAFYMYRSNYVPAAKEPMVYIVSHTWPGRWTTPVNNASITVYSNCDEVELFNDVGDVSLGRKKKGAIGTHFQWNSVPVRYNVLYAVGYVKGKAVAKDRLVLQHLPAAPHFDRLYTSVKNNLLAPAPGYQYVYRVNCGGPDYTDRLGHTWMADRPLTDSSCWGSLSWSAAYPGISPVQNSQRHAADPVKGTRDWPLFQYYRYGRDQLRYHFPVPNGEYLVELYFTEPWYGTGGGMDCSGWRQFDVAVNDSIVLPGLDIWKEAGPHAALKKTVRCTVHNGKITLSFPRVTAGQAVISAIAIAAARPHITPAPPSPSLIQALHTARGLSWSRAYWLDAGMPQYTDDSGLIAALPPELYGAEWIRTCQTCTADTVTPATLQLREAADVYVAMDSLVSGIPAWLQDWTALPDYWTSDYNGYTVFRVFRKHFTAGSTVQLGKNGSRPYGPTPMYMVAVRRRSAFEQTAQVKRPVKIYEAEDALCRTCITDTTTKGFSGKSYVQLQNSRDTLAFRITVGVGDNYSLLFRYRNPSGRQLPVVLSVLSQSGALLRSDEIFFAAQDTRWKGLNSSTGNLNAGTYTIQLVMQKTGKLNLDRMELQ
jgi:hypothetical protein